MGRGKLSAQKGWGGRDRSTRKATRGGLAMDDFARLNEKSSRTGHSLTARADIHRAARREGWTFDKSADIHPDSGTEYVAYTKGNLTIRTAFDRKTGRLKAHSQLYRREHGGVQQIDETWSVTKRKREAVLSWFSRK